MSQKNESQFEITSSDRSSRFVKIPEVLMKSMKWPCGVYVFFFFNAFENAIETLSWLFTDKPHTVDGSEIKPVVHNGKLGHVNW